MPTDTEGENNGMAVGVGGRQTQPAAHRSRPQSAPARGSNAQAARQQRQQRRSAQGQGSAGRRPASASVRSIPPIYEEEDDEESDHYESAKDEGGSETWERSEWKREQKKWSQLAKGALQSMEEDAELTDLALMVRQMESDPAAAATILGEAAVAAADAAIAAQESEDKLERRESGRTFSSVTPGLKGKIGSDSAGSLGRRGWGEYAAEKRRRAARRRGGSRSKKAASGSRREEPAGAADEREGEEGIAAGEDELADYYDWLLSVQQGEEAATKAAPKPKS